MPERTMADLLAEYERCRHAYEAGPTAATEDAAFEAERAVASAMTVLELDAVKSFDGIIYAIRSSLEIDRHPIADIPMAFTIPVPLKVNADD